MQLCVYIVGTEGKMFANYLSWHPISHLILMLLPHSHVIAYEPLLSLQTVISLSCQQGLPRLYPITAVHLICQLPKHLPHSAPFVSEYITHLPAWPGLEHDQVKTVLPTQPLSTEGSFMSMCPCVSKNWTLWHRAEFTAEFSQKINSKSVWCIPGNYVKYHLVYLMRSLKEKN